MLGDTEATFAAMLAAEPLDRDALLIYADWLEDRGELDRAKFARAYRELLGLTHRHPDLLDHGRELLEIAKRLPKQWHGFAPFARPPLAGTCWVGSSMKTPTVMRFRPGGVFNYQQRGTTFENGSWFQLGTYVAIEINAHYADYDGVICGDILVGRAHNVVEQRWIWSMRRTADPAHTEFDDAKVHRTIHPPPKKRKRMKKTKKS